MVTPQNFTLHPSHFTLNQKVVPLESFYYETRQYRCLVETGRFPTEELFLSMCGVEACLPGKGFGPVAREGYHLHAILSGTGYLKVGEREYALRAGELFIVKPGELTAYHADHVDPWHYCWMTFDGAFAHRLASAAGFAAGVNALKCHIDTMQFYHIADAALNHHDSTLADSLCRYGLLSQFIALAVESAAAGGDTQSSALLPVHGGDGYMDAALNFIRRNYASISVTDIAAHLGISRSHLTRLFRRSMDRSPSEYLMHLRMERSAWLLANTAMSVQEISIIIGYEDQLTFSKAFKKVFGVSPKYYRAMPPEERKDLIECEV